MPNLQAQLGQQTGDYRFYWNVELTNPDNYFPNSPSNYRCGIQHSGPLGSAVETGVGDYCNSVFGYWKVSASFDSAGWGK